MESLRHITVEKLVSDKPKLFIDVGNTCIKYRIDTDVEHIQASKIHVADSVSALTSLLKQCSSIYVSSVGKPDIVSVLQHESANLRIPIFIAETKSEELGLTNAYSNPNHMGVDRWLAMLAAKSMSKTGAFIVVDIGTAITADFVKRGKHLGGWIGPGLDLLQESLFTNTQKVFGDDQVYDGITFGTDTPECVNSGCKAQLVGLIKEAISQFSKKSTDFDVFISGGNRNLVKQKDFSTDLIFCENIVLDALSLFVD
jgi:type III pantothenate kinase